MPVRNFLETLKPPYNGVTLAIVIVTATSILHFIGFFQLPDAMLYDLAVRHSPTRSSTPSVLLITVDSKDRDAGDPSWLQVLETLKQLEARQILFGFLPPNASLRFYEQAIAAGNVIFGRGIVASPSGDANEARLEPWPAVVSTLKREPSFGVMTLPPANHGIYRRQYAWHTLQGQQYPAFEAAAAHQLAPTSPSLPDRLYWVNFQGGAHYLPMVGLARVLGNGLIPDLVRGRSVLLGLLPQPLTPRFHTPLEQATDSGISLLKFQGYALETLLHNQPIQLLSPPLIVALLILAALANLIIYQWGGLSFKLWVTGGFLLLYAVAAWLLLIHGQRWPPVTALIVIQIAAFILVFWHQALVEDQALRSLALSLSSQSREQAVFPGFYASTEPWEQVVALVRQTLDLSWLVFLERIPNRFYVREIAVLNCAFADIDEQRRDCRRPPYSDAITERRALRLEQRRFLKADTATNQYLVPLLFGGELLGFWVLGTPPEKIAANPDFFSVVESFRDQIAEMLYHRLLWQQQLQQPDSATLRYLRLEGGEKSYVHTLRQALLALERRAYRLEQVFQAKDTAAIFYNPFGRVLQTNEAMGAILRQTQVPAYEMTALDLLTTFCGVELADGRRILQRVFMDHQTIALPAKAPGDSQHRYTLRAKPVLLAEDSYLPSDAAEALPFQLQGVLLELIDVTTLHDLSLIKTELTERVHRQLRDHFQTMLFAMELPDGSMQEERRHEDRRKSSRLILQQQIAIAVGLINQAQQYLQTDLTALQQLDSYPVEPRAPLRAAIAKRAERADERQVKVTVDTPELLSLVMAESDTLRDVLEILLAVLLEDAVVGSELTVELREREQWLIWDFRNQGFGIPNPKFQAWLSSDDSEATPLFRRLRVARRQVLGWKGQLHGGSTLGKGMRFLLHLPCFGGRQNAEEYSLRSYRHSPHAEARQILVVDDSKMIQRLVTLSLQKEGYQVRAAANGQLAIELLSHWTPDLIVLDIMMPVMDGFQFLEWRKQHQPNVPVLALTGMEHPDSKQQILAAGADAVLFKPMQMPELLARIDQMLSARNDGAVTSSA
ncbi:MAG: response regulator [Candidatus Competibacteraceae bacterium]|nr:response regulator [Candidatus Competibacteraceae bacterium]